MENTTTPAATPSSVGIRYGLLTGALTVLLSFALFATNSEQSPLRFVAYIVLIGGIVLAHNFYKQNNAGFMSYGQGLGLATILSATAGVLGAVFTYVYMEFIDTDFMSHILELNRQQLEARGMSEADISRSMTMAQPFMNAPFFALTTLVVTTFVGFLFSLIISAITKHNRPEFE